MDPPKRTPSSPEFATRTSTPSANCCGRQRGSARPIVAHAPDRRLLTRAVLPLACLSAAFILLTMPFLEDHGVASVRAEPAVVSYILHPSIAYASARGAQLASSTSETTRVLGKIESPDAATNLTAWQASRKKRINDICARNPDLSKYSWPWQLKVDHRRGLIYCPVPKSGWSSWKRVLFFVNGAVSSMETDVGNAPDQKANIMDISPPTVRFLTSLQSRRFFTFVFVRNPWERLVSAYINKALDWNYTRIMHQPCAWESMTPYAAPLTFAQFLTCVVEGSGNSHALDMHWRPMWQMCDFCRIEYDYIGHMETIDADAKDVLRRIGVNGTFPRAFASQAYRSTDAARLWYNSVPCDVIERLRQLYALDFSLHGYSDTPPGWDAQRCAGEGGSRQQTFTAT